MDSGQFLKPMGYPQGKPLWHMGRIWEMRPNVPRKKHPKVGAHQHICRPRPASCVCCCCCATRVKSSEALDDEQRTREWISMEFPQQKCESVIWIDQKVGNIVYIYCMYTYIYVPMFIEFNVKVVVRPIQLGMKPRILEDTPGCNPRNGAPWFQPSGM